MIIEHAVFAAGCFWGVQSAFEEIPGVIGTRVGYTGGSLSHPTYRQVSGGKPDMPKPSKSIMTHK